MIRPILVIVGFCLCLWKFQASYSAAETIRAEGEEILFELAPVDPRELFLGDYMVLNYRLGTQTQWQSETLGRSERPVIPDQPSGIAVIRLEEGVGTVARFDDFDRLATNERLIRYTKSTSRWGRLSIGGDRFYFQSGTGERYEDAAYGIFRVMPDGRALLSGLADEKKRPIAISGRTPFEVEEESLD